MRHDHSVKVGTRIKGGMLGTEIIEIVATPAMTQI